jgi:hypothetical protein
MKIIFFYLLILLRILNYDAQTTIDIIKVKEQLPISILRDTTVLNDNLYITKGESSNLIDSFFYNTRKNRAAVHISSTNIFYYNNEAINKISRYPQRLRNRGYEFLEHNFNECLEINGIKFNSDINNEKYIKIVDDSKIGYIPDYLPRQIKFDEIAFRVPLYTSEICNNDANDISYLSELLVADIVTKKISLKKEFQQCYYGYPILVRETFEHFISSNEHNYFMIMPNNIKVSLKDGICNTIINQDFSRRRPETYSVTINRKYSSDGKYLSGVELSKYDESFRNALEKKLNEICVAPKLEGLFIKSQLQLTINVQINPDNIYNNRLESLKELKENNRKIDFRELDNLLKGLERKDTKLKCSKINVLISGSDFNSSREIISITKIKNPTYAGLLKPFFGFGNSVLLKNHLYFRWVSPSVTIGTGLISLFSTISSQAIYNSYLRTVSTSNNIQLYKTANIFHKLSWVTGGLYFAFTSVNLYLTFNDIQQKRSLIKKINVKIKTMPFQEIRVFN